MGNQEAGGSGSNPKKKRRYIPCEREEAEQRLLYDYFGDDDTLPKYTEEYFRRRSGCGSKIVDLTCIFWGSGMSNNDLNVLYGSPLFDDVLADKALEAPFVVNGRTYKKSYYLADGVYPT
ncbi:reverse transcriptase domain-containing protein [Tanacetum coccineum]|uniref:Reverse transcriptase domain-containing protein n=1 Tax=Tanacetum coccineum TaxID=301880 RepID=A0ABQ5CD42_9ASTR